MGWFSSKKKIQAEDFGRQIVDASLPKAVRFFQESNQQARQKVPLAEEKLLAIGTGTAAYFLSKHISPEHPSTKKTYGRVLSGMRKSMRATGASADRLAEWLKAMTDEELFSDGKGSIHVACKVIWTRTFPETAYVEHPAIKAFAYFLQMEAATVEKYKLV